MEYIAEEAQEYICEQKISREVVLTIYLMVFSTDVLKS